MMKYFLSVCCSLTTQPSWVPGQREDLSFCLMTHQMVFLVCMLLEQGIFAINQVLSRVFPQGLKMRVPGTPLCGANGSFNKI